MSRSEQEIDHSSHMGPQLVAALRQKIILHEWVPGQRLSETEVANVYGVSRQPIREAFIKLREEGLIEVRPQRGSFVRKISSASVLDARFVREAIEADIVRIVAQAADPAVVQVLRGLIDQQQAAADQPNGDFMAIDDQFHRALAQAAGHDHAWETVEGMKSQLDRVRHLSTEHFPRQKVIEEHRVIVDAIAAGDVGAAEAAMRHHLRGIISDLPAIRDRAPEFFELG